MLYSFYYIEIHREKLRDGFNVNEKNKSYANKAQLGVFEQKKMKHLPGSQNTKLFEFLNVSNSCNRSSNIMKAKLLNNFKGNQ